VSEYDLTPEDLGNAERAARRFSATWWQGTSGTLAAWVILLLKERRRMATQLEDANNAVRQAVEARLAGCTLTPAEPAEEATFTDPEPVRVQDADKLEAAWSAVAARHREMQQRLREPQAAEPVERRTVEVPAAASHNVGASVHRQWVPVDPPDAKAIAAGIVPSGWKLEQLRVDDNGETLRPGSREFLAVLEELKALHLAKTLDYGVDEDALANIRSSADVVNMPAWAGCILRMSDKMHRLKAFFRRGRTEFDGVEDTLKDIACYAAIALVLYRETRCTEVQ
jgi:hypothetical protein